MTHTRFMITGALSALLLAALPPAVSAQTPSDAPIRITAKASEYLQNEGRGVWTGDVVATRGDARITTDKLTAICVKSAPAADGNASCDDIEQLIAEGNVLYTAPDVKIRGDKAVYQYGAGIITVTGDVISSRGDEGVVRGKEIVYNIDEGKVRITAGNDRVLSIITPKKKDAPPAGAPATPN
jgi:lipopolysaccharide export system protein LptA